MDPEQIQRAIKIVRFINFSSRTLRGRRRLKMFFDEHSERMDRDMDLADFARRVRDKEVTSSDVRTGASAVVRSLPRVYQTVAKIAAKQRRKREVKERETA